MSARTSQKGPLVTPALMLTILLGLGAKLRVSCARSCTTTTIQSYVNAIGKEQNLSTEEDQVKSCVKHIQMAANALLAMLSMKLVNLLSKALAKSGSMQSKLE